MLKCSTSKGAMSHFLEFQEVLPTGSLPGYRPDTTSVSNWCAKNFIQYIILMIYHPKYSKPDLIVSKFLQVNLL